MHQRRPTQQPIDDVRGVRRELRRDRLVYSLCWRPLANDRCGVRGAGSPRRWRVENSWGSEKNGQKGYYTMNDSWYDEYMFEIAAPRNMLSEAMLKGLATEPIVLPAWDPMGSLARQETLSEKSDQHLHTTSSCPSK